MYLEHRSKGVACHPAPLDDLYTRKLRVRREKTCAALDAEASAPGEPESGERLGLGVLAVLFVLSAKLGAQRRFLVDQNEQCQATTRESLGQREQEFFEEVGGDAEAVGGGGAEVVDRSNLAGKLCAGCLDGTRVRLLTLE